MSAEFLPLTPNIDDLDAVLDCGDVAPGRINDACGHSCIQMLCCVCAGCGNHVWWCGRPQSINRVTDSYLNDVGYSLVWTFVAMLIGLMLTGHLLDAILGLLMATALGGYSLVSFVFGGSFL